VPAAAVIPALVAYSIVVAVKTFVAYGSWAIHDFEGPAYSVTSVMDLGWYGVGLYSHAIPWVSSVGFQ